MTKRGIFADLHMKPGDLFGFDLRGFDEVVDAGDCLDIMPYGLDAWLTPAGELTIKSIIDYLPSSGMVSIWKNHGGRKEWQEKLFEKYPQVKVVDQYEFRDRNNRLFIVKHGSDYTEWRILKIGADDLTSFMCRIPVLRRLWYKFCAWRGWMPSKLKPTTKTLTTEAQEKANKKYQKAANWVYHCANLEAHSHKEDVTIIFGHTHQGYHGQSEFGCEIINLRAGELITLFT